MDTAIARSTAFAIAVLSSALVCAPARAVQTPPCEALPGAGDYAFGCTQAREASLTLVEPTKSDPDNSVTLFTNGFQGWIKESSFGIAGPDGDLNYLAGVYSGTSYKNFFAFDVGGQANVTSAKLTVYSGLISTKMSYSLFGATAVVQQLENGFSPNLTLYDALGTGVKYGSAIIAPNSSFQNIVFTLNAAAVTQINKTAGVKNGTFAVSGDAAVPEPSTWAMMLAGFAGLGLVAYRRRVKRQAAAASA
jgi:hypothetical protein